MGCGSSSSVEGVAPAANPPAPNPAEPAANAPATEENPDQYLASYNELRVKEAFAAYDLDKSGAIDAKELGVVLRNLGRTPTEEELAQYIKESDANGSGVIEFPEFFPLCIKLKLL